MDAMAPFRIPIASLKADEAHYQWDLGPDFLQLFDDVHTAENGRFDVRLDMEKTSGISTLTFSITGIVNTICDRCLAPIELPVNGEYEIIVKFGDPTESTDEVIVLDPETSGLNVGSLIYDFILLSFPITRRIPGCETSEYPPCDFTVLQYLSEKNENDSPGNDDNSLWGDLRKAIDN